MNEVIKDGESNLDKDSSLSYEIRELIKGEKKVVLSLNEKIVNYKYYV